VAFLAWIFLLVGSGVFIVVARLNGSAGTDVPLACWAAPGLISLPLAMRNIKRRHYGAAVAWELFTLPFAISLAFYSIYFTRLFALFGWKVCASLETTCRARPIVYWLPVAVLAAGAVLTAVAIVASKQAEGRRQLWIVRPPK
jgi:hypothetical protein